MVIQRWQSILLLVAAVLTGCFTFCSLGQVQTTDFTYNFTSFGFFQEGIPTGGSVETDYHTWYFFVLSVTTTLLLLIDIFLYKNLPLQKKVCLVSLVFVIASGATAGCLGYTAIEGGTIGWSSVALCPIISIAAVLLAYGCMVRDHNRLKAVDRIR